MLTMLGKERLFTIYTIYKETFIKNKFHNSYSYKQAKLWGGWVMNNDDANNFLYINVFTHTEATP